MSDDPASVVPAELYERAVEVLRLVVEQHATAHVIPGGCGMCNAAADVIAQASDARRDYGLDGPITIAASGNETTSPANLTVTITHERAMPCAVCDRLGWLPDPIDDPDADNATECGACNGKGWATVTETITETRIV